MKKDLDQLQGSWTVTALEMDGEKTPPAMLGEARVEVNGNRFKSTGMGAVYEGTLELDTRKKPAHLDMKFYSGPEKGNINLGIYEVKGDKWKLCLATRGNIRPSKFASKAGSGIAVETLVRGEVAAKGKARPVKKAAAAPASTAPATEFEGEWRMVSGVMNGAVMASSMVEWVKRVFQGDQTSVLAGPQTMMKAVFTLDPSQSPKAIDYQNLAGSHKGKVQLGVYEFNGKVLKICMAAPGAARPKEFASTKGDGRALTVWTR